MPTPINLADVHPGPACGPVRSDSEALSETSFIPEDMVDEASGLTAEEDDFVHPVPFPGSAPAWSASETLPQTAFIPEDTLAESSGLAAERDALVHPVPSPGPTPAQSFQRQSRKRHSPWRTSSMKFLDGPLKKMLFWMSSSRILTHRRARSSSSLQPLSSLPSVHY